MKKVIVLLALVVVGAIVFAEAPTPDYSFSASVTTKWQYDFDTQLSGFTNDSDISLHFDLLNGVKKSKGGESGTYGQIDVTNIYLGIYDMEESGTYNMYNDGGSNVVWGPAKDGDGDNLSVSAKIVSGNLWIGLGKGAYTGDYDNAVLVPLFDSSSGYTNGSVFEPEITPDGSLQIGYKLGDFGSVKAVVGAAAAGASNDFDQYIVGFDAALTPVKDVLALTAGFWYNAGNEMWIATGKAAVTAGSLSANVAIDAAKNYTANTYQESPALYFGTLTDATALAYDISGNITYKLFEGKDSVAIDAYYTEVQGNAVKISYPSYQSHKGDFGFKFVDAEGIVPGLGFTVGAFIDDMLADPANDPMLFSFAESISYKAALSDATYVKPYEEARYDFAAEQLYLKVGVEAVLFPNTTLDANFTSCAEGNDLNHALTSTANKVLTVSAKVSL
jgi:hypothetical protein